MRFSRNRQAKEDFQEDLLLDFADNERSTIFKVAVETSGYSFAAKSFCRFPLLIPQKI